MIDHFLSNVLRQNISIFLGGYEISHGIAIFSRGKFQVVLQPGQP